jgi:uncharacterized protein (TIGR00725 family)
VTDAPAHVIGVIGAGDGATKRDVALAERLGELLAREGWAVLTGGRPVGVMQAAISGAKKVPGSRTIAVLPGRGGPVAAGADVAIFTGIGEARDLVNVLSSRVVVACGAVSAGTAVEAALAVQAGRPLVLLCPQPEAEAFFRSLDAGVRAARTPEEAVEACRHVASTGAH